MHSVFLTGCGSGFGALTAEMLLAAGHQVFATDPDLDSLASLAEAGAETAALDLRDAASIQRAVDRALATTAPTALVNNGGFAVFATQEHADLEQMRDLFDVNVFGAARVTRLLLPRLREVGGTVVQLSSVAGRTVFPESGWYAATKHALEALSEALYQETCTFGVRVRLIEPGSFDTRFLPTAAAVSPPLPASSAYAPLQPTWTARKVEVLEPPQDPRAVARAIVRALDDERPFYREAVGPDAERMLGLKDAIGPDAYSLLAGQRNGGPALWTPAWVLSAPDEDLQPARHAAAAGHLDHWSETEEGARALARLTGS